MHSLFSHDIYTYIKLRLWSRDPDPIARSSHELFPWARTESPPGLSSVKDQGFYFDEGQDISKFDCAVCLVSPPPVQVQEPSLWMHWSVRRHAPPITAVFCSWCTVSDTGYGNSWELMRGYLAILLTTIATFLDCARKRENLEELHREAMENTCRQRQRKRQKRERRDREREREREREMGGRQTKTDRQREREF